MQIATEPSWHRCIPEHPAMQWYTTAIHDGARCKNAKTCKYVCEPLLGLDFLRGE
jgi:hypothetical protein